MRGRDRLGAGQVAPIDDAVEAQLDECREEQKQAAELGAEGPRFEVKRPRVGTISGGRLGVRRSLAIAAAWELGKALLPEDGGHGHWRTREVFFFQSFADIVDGQVLLAELDDALPNGVIGFGAWGWSLHEELPIRLTPELVAQLMKTADGVAKASGDFGAGEMLDKIGPQGFVLPVGSILGREEDLSQVH
jgi:hypothetical protein